MAVRRKRKRHTNDASHARDKDPADWTDAELKVDCPICLSLVYQPVIVPCCGSVLCLSCLEEGLAKSASSCPFCRQRLATWARKTKDKVCGSMWAAMLQRMPDRCERRRIETEEALAGSDDATVRGTAPEPDDSDDDHIERHLVPLEAGELRAQLDQLAEERSRRRHEEEQRNLKLTLALLEKEKREAIRPRPPNDNKNNGVAEGEAPRAPTPCASVVEIIDGDDDGGGDDDGAAGARPKSPPMAAGGREQDDMSSLFGSDAVSSDDDLVVCVPGADTHAPAAASGAGAGAGAGSGSSSASGAASGAASGSESGSGPSARQQQHSVPGSDFRGHAGSVPTAGKEASAALAAHADYLLAKKLQEQFDAAERNKAEQERRDASLAMKLAAQKQGKTDAAALDGADDAVGEHLAATPDPHALSQGESPAVPPNCWVCSSCTCVNERKWLRCRGCDSPKWARPTSHRRQRLVGALRR